MDVKTPLTIITGSLGSGKTTLLKHILDTFPAKIAILMNEFGEISIDSKIIRGTNVEMVELAGGCVCCSLIGEFEAAVTEIIEAVDPEHIIVETTGIAEPDALIFDVQDSLPEVRLDGVITIIDADLMLRYPQIGRTTRMQIEDADILALNKTDLVSEQEVQSIDEELRKINPSAPIIKTTYCQLDPSLLFGVAREREIRQVKHEHQLDYTSVAFATDNLIDRAKFEQCIQALEARVVRAKGFVNFSDGTYLFNFVNGRWDLEHSEKEDTALVFIGKDLDKEAILRMLTKTEEGNR